MIFFLFTYKWYSYLTCVWFSLSQQLLHSFVSIYLDYLHVLFIVNSAIVNMECAYELVYLFFLNKWPEVELLQPLVLLFFSSLVLILVQILVVHKDSFYFAYYHQPPLCFVFNNHSGARETVYWVGYLFCTWLT